MKAKRLVRFTARALGMAVGLALILGSSRAHAYPWMIRHGYTGCMPCHTDPSGGAGALTEYGRAQSDLLLRTRYGLSSDSGEADRTSGLLFGLVAPLPDQLRFGGDFREAFYSNKVEGTPGVVQKFMAMRADLYGDVKVGRFRAAGAIGYIPEGDLPAALTTSPKQNLISREHWLGAELDDDGAWLLRAGRITLPFGIRMIEHNLLVRQLTRTDLDYNQSYGLALSFARDQLRGELMGIAGNFEIHPDAYRERGYSAFVEVAPTTTLAVGASSLFTRATRSIESPPVTDYRYANGVFARYAPAQQLVLLWEVDSIYQSLTWNGHRGGYAAFAQADYESVQGFHLMLTGEAWNAGHAGEPSSFDGWLSAVWFCLPHIDLRLDGIYTSQGVAGGPGAPASHLGETTWLAQVHAFL